MKNKLFLFFLLVSSCASPSSTSPFYFARDKEILGIAIGAPANTVKQALGNPARTNSEKFPGNDYVTWEYGPDTKPVAFFTLDPTGRQVVGKSIWVYENDREYNLDALLKDYFPANHFDKFVPCHERGQEQVLIDRRNGVLIATRDQKTALVAWGDPKLTQLRIDRFYSKCPQLQSPRGNGG